MSRACSFPAQVRHTRALGATLCASAIPQRCGTIYSSANQTITTTKSGAQNQKLRRAGSESTDFILIGALTKHRKPPCTVPPAPRFDDPCEQPLLLRKNTPRLPLLGPSLWISPRGSTWVLHRKAVLVRARRPPGHCVALNRIAHKLPRAVHLALAYRNPDPNAVTLLDGWAWHCEVQHERLARGARAATSIQIYSHGTRSALVECCEAASHRLHEPSSPVHYAYSRE
eukprot:SAG11_NODE_2092_length_3841_cov_2.213789_4_plen_228_part_00